MRFCSRRWMTAAALFTIHCSLLVSRVAAQTDSLASIVDEVVWVVGDEAILKSDIEVTRIQAAMEGMETQTASYPSNWLYRSFFFIRRLSTVWTRMLPKMISPQR